jgi:hypothetical protein
MPRHPPCALHSLSHTPPTQPTTQQPETQQGPHPHPPKGGTSKALNRFPATDDGPDVAVHTTHYKDARVHYPDLKQQPHTEKPRHHTATPIPAGLLEPKPQTTKPPDSSEPQQCAPTPERAGKSMIPLVNTTMGGHHQTPADAGHRMALRVCAP